MIRDVGEYCGQSAYLYRIVSGDRDVMLAVLLGRQANMAASPAVNSIAKHTQRSGKCESFDVTRQPHAARTSSLTKCSLIILGLAAGS